MKKQPITIIIPVYKNYEMFFRYLEVNKKFFAGCEVIVMNDYPDQNITNEVNKIYPEACIVNNKVNLGFAGNVNKGVAKSTRDYVFLMNSDVVLKNDSFINSLKYFKNDSKLFAIGFAQIEKDGKKVGSNLGYFKNGLIHHSNKLITNHQSLITNFWAEGGSSIFRKDIFVKLGMLDEIFNPFYWEDIDLSYRALKSGYKVLFDPDVEVEHHHESTIGKYFDKKKILKTAFRNQIIFQWKNITDFDLLLNHVFNMPRFVIIPGFFDALIRLPLILKSRKKSIKSFTMKDRDVLNI